MSGRLRDERGMTLIELIVVIAILGVISVPLSNAFISFFQHSNETTNRLSESHDAQIAAAWFSQDVQSLGVRDWSSATFAPKTSIELNAPRGGGLGPCGLSGTPNALIRLLWDDPTATSQSLVRVAYVLKTVGNEQQLHRIKCVGNATPVSDLTLAHNVDSIDVACQPSCAAAPAVPQTVSLTLHLKVRGSNDQPLDVTLTGQRRQT